MEPANSDTKTAETEAQVYEGEPRRQRVLWTEADARKVLGELERSGETIACFAQRRGINPSTLHKWRQKLGLRYKDRATESAQRRGFVRVQVKPAAAPVALGECESGLIVEVSGCQIRVQRGFDVGLLRAIVETLGRSEGKTC